MLGTRRLAARQRAKRIQVDRLCPLGREVCVDEGEVGELILGVVVNVLGHIRVEDTQGGGVGCAPTPAWDFAVLDAAELVVLLPQVGFERLKHS